MHGGNDSLLSCIYSVRGVNGPHSDEVLIEGVTPMSVSTYCVDL